MRLFPKDTYLNGEHIAHEPSIFQVAAREGHYLPQIIIGGILFYSPGERKPLPQGSGMNRTV